MRKRRGRGELWEVYIEGMWLTGITGPAGGICELLVCLYIYYSIFFKKNINTPKIESKDLGRAYFMSVQGFNFLFFLMGHL